MMDQQRETYGINQSIAVMIGRENQRDDLDEQRQLREE